MRTRPSAQLVLIIVLFYLNYFFYFHRWTFLSNYVPEKVLVKSFLTHRHAEEFCVAYNVTLGTETFRGDGLEPVTLAVHSTSSYINYLFRQATEWEGPISFALFLGDRSSRAAVDFLYSVHICDKGFAKKVSLHVIFKLPIYSSCPTIDISTIPCANITYKYMNSFMNGLIPNFGIYPINVMRNVARRGSPSHFQLISDIEMIFSEHFALSAKKLANENLCEDCRNVIVIRRFELEEKIKKVPRNISELKAHIDNKNAFEFHHKHFPAGHTIEGLWHWLGVSANSTAPYLMKISYKSPAWEPQVIVHSSAPYAWEKVPTRLRDQQAAIYELCRAEYNFFLATHLFNVHKGVKRALSPLERAISQNQLKLKEKYLAAFKKRMDEIYHNTTSKCGKFTM